MGLNQIPRLTLGEKNLGFHAKKTLTEYLVPTADNPAGDAPRLAIAYYVC